MKFTILGATGFIGRHLVAHLQSQEIAVNTPPRDISTLQGQDLGHVIYAIGLTGDFRQRTQATIDAHVNTLFRLKDRALFESWTYLSSTRIYSGITRETAIREDEVIEVSPSADTLYDVSKLLGEALCLTPPDRRVRIARLSNVYGSGQSVHSFLGAVIQSLREQRAVTFREDPTSEKDYISIEDVCRMLQAVALDGEATIYNVASGINVSHRDVAAKLSDLGYQASFTQGAPTRKFPSIDTTRISKLTNPATRSVLADLPDLIARSSGAATH